MNYLKIDFNKSNLFLFYGENQGYKDEVIKEKFKVKYKTNTYNYDENEVLNNKDDFFNKIYSKSFFESEKLIIINRATDKITNTIEGLIDGNTNDLTIILNANALDRKSKIRSLFEKNKKTICVPFYEDSEQTLSLIVSNFFRKHKVPISQQTINLITQRSRGDRLNLNNELKKIQNYIANKKTIEITDILKLTNLSENYDVSELVDSCLAKNKKKTINILNENNYSLEDCILIIRTFLLKSKRLNKLSKILRETNNIESTISSYKPTIFWKEKETVKKQLGSWSLNDIERLIYEINNIELLIKKHNNNSISILFNFIIEKSSTANNSI